MLGGLGRYTYFFSDQCRNLERARRVQLRLQMWSPLQIQDNASIEVSHNGHMYENYQDGYCKYILEYDISSWAEDSETPTFVQMAPWWPVTTLLILFVNCTMYILSSWCVKQNLEQVHNVVGNPLTVKQRTIFQSISSTPLTIMFQRWVCVVPVIKQFSSDFPLVAMTMEGAIEPIYLYILSTGSQGWPQLKIDANQGGHLPTFFFRWPVVFLASMGWKQHLSTGYNGDVLFLFHDSMMWWEVCSWEASQDFGDLKVL